jgi:hypothetical protein
MNGSTSTLCVPDVTKSVHDLSYDNTTAYYQPASQQDLYGNNTYVPFTSTLSADIDILWSYQLHNDDDALIFDT